MLLQAMLLQAILAAVFGNVVMTLSSTTEMQWRGRQESTVPGQATAKLLGFIGIKPIEGRNLKILSNWTHWVYGAAWGIVFWVYIDVVDFSLVATAALFLVTVWGMAQINYGVLRLVPPFWTWGSKEVAIDLFHHAAYVTGTVVGWVLIEQAVV